MRAFVSIAVLLVLVGALAFAAGPFGGALTTAKASAPVMRTTTVTGNIIAGDIALPGLTIIVRTKSGDTLGTAFTDDQGHFQVSDIPSDEDTTRVVEVRWGGHKLLMRRHLLVTGTTVPVTFRLQ